MVNDRWEVALGLTDGSGFQQAATFGGGGGGGDENVTNLNGKKWS